MPPRYAYWTILIDNQPTAFRARERDELLPTYNQLARKNSVIAMKWFARGKLWDSPEAEREAQAAPRRSFEKRNRDWRPGGEHKDPRARFDKKKVHRQHTSEKPRSQPSEKPAAPPTFRKPDAVPSLREQDAVPTFRSVPARKTFRPPPPKGKYVAEIFKSAKPGDRPQDRRPWGRKPPGPRKPKPPED
jgi:hypothetical protein